MAIMSYIDAITLAMKEEMTRDERVFVLGEDVGRKGGVFKATNGLYDEFGEYRVLDTPLAESFMEITLVRGTLPKSNKGNKVFFLYFRS